MQTIQLKIDDSIFDKFMGLIDILPKNKIEIENSEYKKKFVVSSIDEVQKRVLNAEKNAKYISSNNFWLSIDKKIENR